MCSILEIHIGIPLLDKAISYAENQYPAVCKTATVMPSRSPFGIPISTSLSTILKIKFEKTL